MGGKERCTVITFEPRRDDSDRGHDSLERRPHPPQLLLGHPVVVSKDAEAERMCIKQRGLWPVLGRCQSDLLDVQRLSGAVDQRETSLRDVEVA